MASPNRPTLGSQAYSVHEGAAGSSIRQHATTPPTCASVCLFVHVYWIAEHSPTICNYGTAVLGFA